jgi:hypothetical protein
MLRRLHTMALPGVLLLGGCLEADPSYNMIRALRDMPLQAGSYQLCETPKKSCSDVTVRHGDAEMILRHKGDDYTIQMDAWGGGRKWITLVKAEDMAVFTFVDLHDDGAFHMQIPKCHSALLEKVRGEQAEVQGGRCRVSGAFQAEQYIEGLLDYPTDQRFEPADMILRPQAS